MAYAVIYDYREKSTGEWVESFYEAFDSPESAIETFQVCFGDNPSQIYNPRIVSIGSSIPGNWNTERS